MTVRTSGQKLCFVTFREACGWLIAERADNYTKCLHCDPR